MTSRRDTVRALGSLAALPFLGLRVDELIEVGRAAHDRATHLKPQSLTPEQYAIVEQSAEIVLPRTATPGATDARVADFIDVMIADWYSPAERDRFVAGVNEVAGRGFARMKQPERIALLETLDRERTDGHWFAMLKHLTVWGYYTSRVGMVDELRVQLTPGRYDGNATY